MNDKLLTVKQVMAHLGVCRRTVERMMAEHALTRIKLPRGGVRILESEVLALVKPTR